MTLAASLEGNLIWLIAAAAYGVFAWWNERRQKKALAEEEARTRAQGGSAQTPLRPEKSGETSEEERMRKFLEALGVPSAPQSPPLRPAPAPPPKPAPAPEPAKPASPTLAPRPIAMPVPRQFPKPAPRAPLPPITPAARPVIRQPLEEPEFADAGRFEEPAASMEQISADFSRMHDQPMAVANVPSIAVAASGSAPSTSVTPRFVSSQGIALRELLRSPETLRAAVVVSEVLGPPKGL